MTTTRKATPGFERARRGTRAVLVCLLPRNYPGHEHERCPYHVIISEPGDDTQEEQARKVAAEHHQQWHGGMSADIWAAAVKGQLEQNGHIGR